MSGFLSSSDQDLLVHTPESKLKEAVKFKLHLPNVNTVSCWTRDLWTLWSGKQFMTSHLERYYVKSKEVIKLKYLYSNSVNLS